MFYRKNKDRFFFFSFEHGIPKIHVNDGYERQIKWALRTFVWIGVASTVFAFQEWYLNLALALFLLGLQQLLERAIFVFFTIYVAAIPDYRPGDWEGMVWIFQENTHGNYYEVGIYFSSRDAAGRIFPTIKHWSKEGIEDVSNLVQLSVIIDDKDNYHVYIYQNTERDPDYIRWIEKREKEYPGKEHKPIIFSMTMCKSFVYSTSFFPKFQKRYRDGETYYLSAYVLEEGVPVKLVSLGYLKKNRMKIMHRKDLTKSDREYDHGRFVIETTDYDELEPPQKSREFIARKS